MRLSHLGSVLAGLVLAPAVAGCSLVVDGALQDRVDGGPDASFDAGPPPTACTGRPDGTFCDIEGLVDREVCVGGVCVVSSCGDGYADTRAGHPSGIAPTEVCDDGNVFDGDGCDNDCTFSCETQADCLDDTETCNGVPDCSTDHTCTGENLPDSTICDVVGTDPVVVGTCQSGTCRAGVCGNGSPEPGEECDDGNADDTDGCRADCTWTCETDEECQDGDACNGSEICDARATHTCSPGPVPDCDDMDPCTIDTCDTGTGCVWASVLVDADGDGYAAPMGSCGGDDCNDANPAINPGAVEGCGTTTDLNCDGMIATTPRWYVDCDRDGYAANSNGSVLACTAPSTGPSSCTSGSWTSRAPTTSGAYGSIDCYPSNYSAHPYQTNYYYTAISSGNWDYNCSGLSTREFPYRYSGYTPSACQWDSRHNCVGSTYYDVTSAPTCGATVSVSACGVVTVLGSEFCTRGTASSRVRCH